MSRTMLGNHPRLILLSFLMLFVELALIRWTGYRALLILVAVLYGLALLFGRRHLTEEPADEGAELEPSAAQPVPAS